AALWWQFDEVGPGESVTVRLRLTAPEHHELQQGHETTSTSVPEATDEVLSSRRREADEFYAEVIPEDTTDEDRHIARRAFAGLQWGKQLYLYDVPRWLAGDPGQPPPPPQRADRHTGRNVH